MATSKIESQKPFPFTEAHPKFRVPGWRELLGEEETMSATDIVRHFLMTGETGSGKSLSGVFRVTEGVLRYPEADLYAEYEETAGSNADSADSLRPAVLVIDPKQELGDLVDREAHGRKVHRITYGEGGQVLYMFEGRDLNQLDAGEAAELILQQCAFFTQDQATTREPIWNMQAASTIRDFMTVDMFLARRGMDEVKELWDNTREELNKDSDFKGLCDAVRYDARNYFRAMQTILSLAASDEGRYALGAYLSNCEKLGVPSELIVRLTSLYSLCQNTRSCVLWMTNGIFAEIASEELAACVSLNPLESPSGSEALSVEDVIENGDAVVYIPTLKRCSVAETVGRCLKSKFFEYAFMRSNKVRPFFYIVDEAHRFISSGDQDGEQNLLDRCRAFRTGVVLSTQSVSSMALQLEGAPGGGRNTLDVMLNNCGTALYFKTNDIQTQHNVRDRIPMAPLVNRPHVINVRPLSSLKTGSCYVTRSNGQWGLFQVHLPN